MGWPQSVTLYEVGPRDGLQNEADFVTTKDKIELVNRLTDAGFQHIEVTSFVSPRWIPQLADATEVLSNIERKPGVIYSALVPNMKGLEQALTCQIDEVNVFMSASESHNRKNINKSIAETFGVLRPVIETARQAGKPVRGYVSTVFGCPYEGSISLDQVVSITETLFSLGVDEVSLGDTIGVAVPTQVTHVLKALADKVDLQRIALHFHDTRGMAIANVMAGVQSGVHTFDSAIGGLGGCPYAPGASGNVATDDLFYLFSQMGIDTGLSGDVIRKTTQWFEQMLGKPLASHSAAILRGQREGDV
jgi:hydroxymethylglutaryl-CoA lyase